MYSNVQDVSANSRLIRSLNIKVKDLIQRRRIKKNTVLKFVFVYLYNCAMAATSQFPFSVYLTFSHIYLS